MSQAGRFTPGTGAPPIETVTSNIGGPIGPDASGNINIVGGNNITGTGNLFTNTITFDLTGTTDHAVQVGNATGSLTSIPVGTNGQTLIGNTGADPSFAAIGTLSGLTAHGFVIAEGNGAFVATGSPTDGQLPIGSTGNDPVLATLTAGANITITNAPGSITISSMGSAGLMWTVIAANQTLVISHGYFTNAGGNINLLLPAVSAVGDTIQIAAMSAGGFTITQGAAQQIRLGNVATTAGAGGSIASTAQGDWITLVCSAANTTWMASSNQGNFSVV